MPTHTALRIAIVAAGIRQYAIADRLGLSDGQLSKILSGRKPLTDELAQGIREAIAAETADREPPALEAASS